MCLPVQKCKQAKAVRGVAAVEFTILMAFMFSPLVLGTIEIARVLFEYNSVVKSVRNSAKYISVTSATLPSYATQVANAKCLAVFGNIACTGSPVVPGLTMDRISIATSNAGSAGTVVIKLVTVTASGYQLGYVSSFFSGGTKAFNNISVTMRQATT